MGEACCFFSSWLPRHGHNPHKEARKLARTVLFLFSFPPSLTYIIDMGGYLSTIIGLGVVSLGLGKLNSRNQKLKIQVDPDAGLIETLPPELEWLSCPINFDHRHEQFM
jgi:hypothetical protein